MCVLLYLDIKKPTDISVSPVGVIFFDIEKEQIEYINLLSILPKYRLCRYILLSVEDT